MAQTVEGPSYWGAQMPLCVEKRESLPDVARFQHSYVRYSTDTRATCVSTGWSKAASLRAQQQLSATDRAQVDMNNIPEQISMQIIRAPAEFTVPVKQDRRLKPSFKVRVNVWHRDRVFLPVVIMAHAVTEEEYHELQNWIPPALDAAVTGEMVDRSTPTELKGSQQVQHTFDLPSAEPVDAKVASIQLSGMSSFLDSPDGSMMQADVPAEGTNERSWHGTMLALQNLVHDDQRGGSKTAPGGGQPAAAAGLERLYQNRTPQAASLSAKRSLDAQAPLRCSFHDFDFEKMEFARPSRMNKVYLVFSGQVSNVDIIFTVLDIPTICFCRREQKERAYAKLSVPYRAALPPRVLPQAASNVPKPTPFQPRPRDSEQPAMKRPRSDVSTKTTSMPGQPPEDPFAFGGYGDNSSGPAAISMPGDAVGNMQGGFARAGSGISEQQVRDYIEESYNNTALTRALTHMDRSALLELAGFPQMHQAMRNVTINSSQFEDFKRGWEDICALLMKIRSCWVANDPHVICGFELDHAKAVMQLRDQPPGTFLCRFSLSQLGKLVLVCKVPANSPGADQDSLVHGLLNVNDLRERQVDSWINDFPGATHLLDVYTGKRVDKRKAFPSNYTRLERLQELHTNTGAAAAYSYMADQSTSGA